jgi:excisionase family DNA binding protein
VGSQSTLATLTASSVSFDTLAARVGHQQLDLTRAPQRAPVVRPGSDLRSWALMATVSSRFQQVAEAPIESGGPGSKTLAAMGELAELLAHAVEVDRRPPRFPAGVKTWLTPQEVAQTVKLAYATILRAIRAEELRATKACGKWRIDSEDFERWLDAGRPPAWGRPHWVAVREAMEKVRALSEEHEPPELSEAWKKGDAERLVALIGEDKLRDELATAEEWADAIDAVPDNELREWAASVRADASRMGSQLSQPASTHLSRARPRPHRSSRARRGRRLRVRSGSRGDPPDDPAEDPPDLGRAPCGRLGVLWRRR